MSIENYFSLGYLVKFGYFDFKPKSRSLPDNVGISYLTASTFHYKVFNCNDLFDNLESILKLQFNIYEDTIPIEFTVYKTDESRRIYKMPNIYSYICLSLHLYKNKNMYLPILNSTTKSLSNTFYNKGFSDNKKQTERNRFGMKYIFKTDIQEFYPNLYTHSIPWMLVGKENAKANKNTPTLYYNELDRLIQRCQYGETYGIPMGTFASRLISEIYMCKLDSKMDSYNYTRYVDDFELAYNNDEEQKKFYKDLTKELSELHLKIKIEKNKKIVFPFNIEDKIRELNLFFEREDLKTKSLKDQAREIHQFIDVALHKSENGVKGAPKLLFLILTSAIKSGKIDKLAIYNTVTERLLNLTLMKPILSGYFIDLIYEINDPLFNTAVNRMIDSNKVAFLTNIDRYIEIGYNEEACSILSIFYLLETQILGEDELYKIIDNMDDFNTILAIELYEKLPSVDWSKLFTKLESKLESSYKFELSFWLLKYEIFYKVKNLSSSKFTKEYKKYIYDKYGSGINKSIFFNPKQLKNVGSNIVYERQLDKSNSTIAKFYKTLIEKKVKFLKRY